MAKSAQDYIKENDFEGAKERFDNTSPSWKKRWFKVCQEIFNNCKELAKKYVLNAIDFTIKEIQAVKEKFAIKKVKKNSSTNNIFFSEDCTSLLEDVKEKCYLFEFHNDNDELVCSKIGTTTRPVLQRLREELGADTYKKMGATKAVVLRVYDCGKIPAEGLESEFRAKYIRKYPESFKKNDRFMNTIFDLAEADKIVENYLAPAV